MVDWVGRPSYFSGTIGGKVMRGGHKDQPEDAESHHEEEAFCASPDVQHLGHRNVDRGGDGPRDDRDDGQKRVGLEGARDEGVQSADNRGFEAVDERQ